MRSPRISVRKGPFVKQAAIVLELFPDKLSQVVFACPRWRPDDSAVDELDAVRLESLTDPLRALRRDRVQVGERALELLRDHLLGDFLRSARRHDAQDDRTLPAHLFQSARVDQMVLLGALARVRASPLRGPIDVMPVVNGRSGDGHAHVAGVDDTDGFAHASRSKFDRPSRSPNGSTAPTPRARANRLDATRAPWYALSGAGRRLS